MTTLEAIFELQNLQYLISEGGVDMSVPESRFKAHAIVRLTRKHVETMCREIKGSCLRGRMLQDGTEAVAAKKAVRSELPQGDGA